MHLFKRSVKPITLTNTYLINTLRASQQNLHANAYLYHQAHRHFNSMNNPNSTKDKTVSSVAKDETEAASID